MKMEIENERVNRLLHRTELSCVIDTGGKTPSRNDIIKQIAAKKGVSENLVIVDNIHQEYGKKQAKAYVKVYESEKAAQGIENKHQIERAKKAMAEKEPQAKEEEPTAEKEPGKEEPAKEEAPKKEEPIAEKEPGKEKPAGEK